MARRYSVNPLSLLELDPVGWSLLLEIAAAGGEQDRKDAARSKALARGEVHVEPVTAESRLQLAKKKKRRG